MSTTAPDWDPESEVPEGPDNRLDYDDLSPRGYSLLNHKLEEESPEYDGGGGGIIESHNRWFYETMGGQTRHHEFD